MEQSLRRAGMFLTKADQKDGNVPKSPFNNRQPLPSVGKQST